MTSSYDAAKRAIDVSVASVALLLFSPIILLCAVMVRLAMGHPVIFRQLRPGLHGRLFTIYKFRTMRRPGLTEGTDSDDSERLTRLGRFLRSTSLDELPELVNVLKGDMSLVGPRPLLPEYLPLYSERHSRRHTVIPGITGWAQVNGRNTLPWRQRLDLDVWYVQHRSLRLDVKILLMTIMQVLRRKGISHPGEDTMRRLDANSR